MNTILGCKQGRFGINCVQTCHGCLLSECNGETGICTNSSGCRPGWEKGFPRCNVGLYILYECISFSEKEILIVRLQNSHFK